MQQKNEGCYEFGPFRLDPSQQQLFANGEAVALTPKAFDTLLLLVRNSGRLVSKEELLRTVWPDVVVEEATVAQNIFRLRKVLGEDADGSPYIETVPKRGYRFRAQVHTVTSPPPQARAAVGPRPALVAALALVVALGAIYWRAHRANLPPTDKSKVVIADFDNTTGDAVFDDALRQAVTVEFEQTPFLSVMSRDRLSAELKLMRRAPEERLTPAVAREICQRSASAVLVTGTISKLGTHFVLGLDASDCRSGDLLASEQVEAETREKVLSRLADAGGRIRARLGESLASIQRYDIPVERATTASLEALQAYSRAVRLPGGSDVIPLLQHAIELDPGFAAAYSTLGGIYTDLGEYQAASDCYQKAYQLRERLTEREQLHATADYHAGVVGDLDRANETYRIWQRNYPRDAIPYNDLAYDLELAGQYEQELPQAVRANRNDPSLAAAYVHLMFSYAALGRMEDARGAYRQAIARNLEDYPYIHYMMYQLATVAGDAVEAQRQLEWSRGKLESEGWMLSFQADVEAYSGHRQKAQELSARASALLARVGRPESAALVKLDAAWRDAEFGDCPPARAAAEAALKDTPTQSEQVMAALLLASCGGSARAGDLLAQLRQNSAGNTLLSGYWLPTIQALVDLDNHDSRKALTDLRAATAYELGIPEPTVEEAAPFLPVYVRGRAYLLLRNGKEAAAEFQKLITYRAITTNSPLAALAPLQLGRALELQGDVAGARSSYQRFLSAWKDADPEIPALISARSEFAQLATSREVDSSPRSRDIP
ncbi:MAG TPA: winged helix-turn-helix domain-containing protein [Steroidobacteraceae bacterium]|nr:winged helix-turn-helix domain-containing protein [Steroidobacteraceae bacterium]